MIVKMTKPITKYLLYLFLKAKIDFDLFKLEILMNHILGFLIYLFSSALCF